MLLALSIVVICIFGCVVIDYAEQRLRARHEAEIKEWENQERKFREYSERRRQFEEYMRMTRQRPVPMPENPDEHIKLMNVLWKFWKPTTDEEVAAAMLLGVSVHATPDEVRHAFRQKARKTHPDRAPLWDSDALVRFVQLTEAKRTLEDRHKRLKAEGWLR